MFIPAQCSEREAGGQEDCTWASGVMLQNAHQGANIRPATRHEYEALRVAGGDGPAENPGDGSNMRQLAVGISRRYGWTGQRVGPPGLVRIPFGQLWRLLPPGHGAALQGSMGAFPRTGYWRRWDSQFGGPHCVYVQRLTSRPEVWWMNPSAPNSFGGELMGVADLRRYYDAWVGGALFTAVGLPDTSTGEGMKAFGTYQSPSIATTIRETRLYTEVSDSGQLSGTSYVIPKGHTKRAIAPGPGSTVMIVHDRDSAVEGKSVLFGKAADWNVRISP